MVFAVLLFCFFCILGFFFAMTDLQDIFQFVISIGRQEFKFYHVPLITLMNILKTGPFSQIQNTSLRKSTHELHH